MTPLSFGHSLSSRPALTPPQPRPVPAAAQAQVWLDFDGTITTQDVLDRLIIEYAVNDAWKLIEERWQAGLIGSRDCLREEFALLRILPGPLREFLDTVPVDPGFEGLLALLERHAVPAAVLSDGIDRFIRRILRRHGADRLEVRANALRHRGDRLRLQCPHADAACESAAAHCKCASARALNPEGRKTIYVGDGRSDLCPARKADLVFAKGALAASLRREGRPFLPFQTLADVADGLARAWGKGPE